MSFYQLPNPWNPGYAIPEYVMAEPPERGTFTTQWLPRGTISTLVPDMLAKPGRKLLGRNDAGLNGLGSLGGCTLANHSLKGTTLSGSSLGDEPPPAGLVTPIDPSKLPTQPDPGWLTQRTIVVGGIAAAAVYFLTKKSRRRARRNPSRRRRSR